MVLGIVLTTKLALTELTHCLIKEQMFKTWLKHLNVSN